MVGVDRYQTPSGGYSVRIINNKTFMNPFQPAEKGEPSWLCRCCKKDKTYKFSYQLKKSGEWWCEDCVREAGLIW